MTSKKIVRQMKVLGTFCLQHEIHSAHPSDLRSTISRLRRPHPAVALTPQMGTSRLFIFEATSFMETRYLSSVRRSWERHKLCVAHTHDYSGLRAKKMIRKQDFL